MASDELELLKTEDGDFERLENDYRRKYGWLRHRWTRRRRLLVETLASWADVGRDRAARPGRRRGASASGTGGAWRSWA